MENCPVCGCSMHKPSEESARKQVRDLMLGYSEIHQQAFRHLFKAMSLLEGGRKPREEYAFLVSLGKGGVDSTSALLVLAKLQGDSRFWTKLRVDVSHRWSYLTRAVVRTVQKQQVQSVALRAQRRM